MRLDDLIADLAPLDLHNVFPDTEISSVVCDSRAVSYGSVFVAIPGERLDGHDHITEALESGASVVVQSRPLEPGRLGSFIRVADSRAAYALMCAAIAGHPSRRIRVIGVTGTNGKTSTALLIAHLLEEAGYRPAVLGTLGIRRPGSSSFEVTGLTTPDAGSLQQGILQLVEDGASHLVMEVSSHSLAMNRVLGLNFAGAVFTNLTQDHLDYHGTMEEYGAAKALLFEEYLPASGGYAVVNIDDPFGSALAARASVSVAKYGVERAANLVMTDVECRAGGTSWCIVLKNGVWPARLLEMENSASLASPLVGQFNAYNCTAAAAVALLEGLTLEQVAKALPTFPGVPGRLERVPNSLGLHAFVDYAHTPDALNNVLAALGEVRAPEAKIITVFGCGGDRDPLKRPLMGKAAQLGSDVIVVTSDNPRSEDPQAIITQVMQGVDVQRGGVYVQADRRLAIRQAMEMAEPGDILLVAGKGHEDYQIFADRTIHFSDKEELAACFEMAS